MKTRKITTRCNYLIVAIVLLKRSIWKIEFFLQFLCQFFDNKVYPLDFSWYCWHLYCKTILWILFSQSIESSMALEYFADNLYFDLCANFSRPNSTPVRISDRAHRQRPWWERASRSTASTIPTPIRYSKMARTTGFKVRHFQNCNNFDKIITRKKTFNLERSEL